MQMGARLGLEAVCATTGGAKSKSNISGAPVAAYADVCMAPASVQHPDVLACNAALLACLGDLAAALAKADA